MNMIVFRKRTASSSLNPSSIYMKGKSANTNGAAPFNPTHDINSFSRCLTSLKGARLMYTAMRRAGSISTMAIMIAWGAPSQSAMGLITKPNETKIRICMIQATPSKNFRIVCLWMNGWLASVTPAL